MATKRSPLTPSGSSPTRMGATTVEVPTNHVAMVSHPDDVVKLVKTAAESVAVPEAALV